MSDNRYIGVFDSGIGGLTVVKSIVDSMPGENIIYFGDTAHVPYGTRSERQITEYVLADVRFLRTFDIKAVVIACNTADSVAKEKVRETYPDLPVFGVVDPASRLAAETTKNGKVGVIATNARSSCPSSRTAASRPETRSSRSSSTSTSTRWSRRASTRWSSGAPTTRSSTGPSRTSTRS